MSDLTEALEGIRERAEAFYEDDGSSAAIQKRIDSQADVPALLEALEAVLEYADDTTVYEGALTDYQTGYQDAIEETRDDIRRAIYKHLGGDDD